MLRTDSLHVELALHRGMKGAGVSILAPLGGDVTPGRVGYNAARVEDLVRRRCVGKQILVFPHNAIAPTHGQLLGVELHVFDRDGMTCPWPCSRRSGQAQGDQSAGQNSNAGLHVSAICHSCSVSSAAAWPYQDARRTPAAP